MAYHEDNYTFKPTYVCVLFSIEVWYTIKSRKFDRYGYIAYDVYSAVPAKPYNSIRDHNKKVKEPPIIGISRVTITSFIVWKHGSDPIVRVRVYKLSMVQHRSGGGC